MRYLVLLIVSIVAFSCVTNKKYVYLQEDDVNEKDLPEDTKVREYEYQEFDYKIQPQDILYFKFESLTPKEFNFFSTEGISNQGLNANVNPLLIGELVDTEGFVPFPVIGKVKVAGLTIFEAQDTLQKVADLYLETPLVKVRLINFRITILGEVQNEGTFTFTNNRVNMLEAVSLAGGLTDLADKKNVKLIRHINGKTEVQYLNFLEEDLLSSPFYFVNQNDVLIVPALRQRPYRKYFGQNVSLVVSLVSLIVLTLNLTR